MSTIAFRLWVHVRLLKHLNRRTTWLEIMGLDSHRGDSSSTPCRCIHMFHPKCDYFSIATLSLANVCEVMYEGYWYSYVQLIKSYEAISYYLLVSHRAYTVQASIYIEHIIQVNKTSFKKKILTLFRTGILKYQIILNNFVLIHIKVCRTRGEYPAADETIRYFNQETQFLVVFTTDAISNVAPQVTNIPSGLTIEQSGGEFG